MIRNKFALFEGFMRQENLVYMYKSHSNNVHKEQLIVVSADSLNLMFLWWNC